MNIFKSMEGIFDTYSESKDMADFSNLPGKLEPRPYVKRSEPRAQVKRSDKHIAQTHTYTHLVFIFIFGFPYSFLFRPSLNFVYF